VETSLHNSKRYKTFIADRNRALEQVHLNAQTDISRMLFEVLDRITGYVSHMGMSGRLSVIQINQLSGSLEGFIDQNLGILFHNLVSRIQRLRKNVFVLTYTSEMEAIGRATQTHREPSPHEFKKRLDSVAFKPTLDDQKIENRIWLGLMKVRSKIVNAFNLAVVQELTPLEVVQKVKASYPEILQYKRPPRTLKPLREAGYNPYEERKEAEEFYDFDFISDGDWDLATQAYKDSELPASRFDQEALYDPEVGYQRYSWEVEQEVTEDFVKSVRDGQVDAAKDLGIQDFVWVAILDDHTCEKCCLPRAGKLSSEIEKMLASKELDADECDAITPPAHMNCRCDVAPVASTDEVEGPDWKSFGEWLDT